MPHVACHTNRIRPGAAIGERASVVRARSAKVDTTVTSTSSSEVDGATAVLRRRKGMRSRQASHVTCRMSHEVELRHMSHVTPLDRLF
jgi:hypothetical protein